MSADFKVFPVLISLILLHLLHIAASLEDALASGRPSTSHR